jgi:putative hydroxymethylpyrimidine transporter CytX
MVQTHEDNLIAGVPEWGIEPVPPQLRRFGPFDAFVLWFNLGISLLLPIVAAFLVPGLSFWEAALATLVGVVIGNLMLGYAGRIGAATGAPAMVLYRPSLGQGGSYAATVLNVLQNVGWGAFELIVIGSAAAAISRRLFGVEIRWAWTILFGAIVTLMAVGGPLLVVREWLRRYAIWMVLAASIYLTGYVLAAGRFGLIVHAHGHGMPFWQGVDLVVAMPISWIALAADYTRFGRSARSSFAGAGIGYGMAQTWFYLLGVFLILSKVAPNLADTNAFIAAVVGVPIGVLVMAILAIGEVDKPFANVYSASVSVQNGLPQIGQRRLSVIVGAVCTAIAVVVPLAQYQNFLLLVGAVFVPLFGVQAAHYIVVRRGYSHDDLYGAMPRVRVWGCVCWLAGFAAYNWLNPGTVTWWLNTMKWVFHTMLHAPFPGTASTPWLSASIASFLIAFVLQAAQAVKRSTSETSIRAVAPQTTAPSKSKK